MKLITKNKKAFFDYEISDTFEAGIMLTGDEVKSIRAGNVNLADTFATVYKGEIMLTNCYIGPYAHAYTKADTSRRPRKLLLHKKEINKIIGLVSKKGYTLVVTKMYFNSRSLIKVIIGLAKHKKARDKKKELRERDIKRETDREIKQNI